MRRWHRWWNKHNARCGRISEDRWRSSRAPPGTRRAIALELAANGAKVACVARNAEKLAATAALIAENGGVAEAVSCDVKDGAQVNKVVDGVADKWKRLDILVNNAGSRATRCCPA